ncbi:uncharacterized protein PG986_000031 [Apiospora aurea]|uniref:Uncharacterized protein n=1 Tax=Apiospora aurea TaxID=335848 RepID=A0ABR1QSW7_9PEZI
MSSQLPNFSRTNRPAATSVASRRLGRYNDATTSIHPSSPSPTYASGVGRPLSRHQHDTEDDGIGVKAATVNAAQQAASRSGLGSHEQRPPPPRARPWTPSDSNASSFCRRLRNESALHFSPVDLDLALVELASVDELSLIKSYEKEVSASRHTSLDVVASAASLSHVYRSSSTQTEMGRRTRRVPASPTVATSSSSPGHPVRMHLYPHSECGESQQPRWSRIVLPREPKFTSATVAAFTADPSRHHQVIPPAHGHRLLPKRVHPPVRLCGAARDASAFT